MSGPTPLSQQQDLHPQQDLVYNRHLTEQEYLNLGGQLAPTVTTTQQSNPSAEFVRDASGRYALKVSASVVVQHVNQVDLTLSAVIKHSTSGSVLFSQSQPYNASQLLPHITPFVVPMGFTLSAGTNTCGIQGRAELRGSGMLQLLNNNWSPITLYALPLFKLSNEPRLPDCEQRRTEEEPAPKECADQTAFAPTDCTGSGSQPPNGGQGGSCGLWVRRIWVTYDGGRTWYLESETFFTRC